MQMVDVHICLAVFVQYRHCRSHAHTSRKCVNGPCVCARQCAEPLSRHARRILHVARRRSNSSNLRSQARTNAHATAFAVRSQTFFRMHAFANVFAHSRDRQTTTGMLPYFFRGASETACASYELDNEAFCMGNSWDTHPSICASKDQSVPAQECDFGITNDLESNVRHTIMHYLHYSYHQQCENRARTVAMSVVGTQTNRSV